MKKQTTVIVKDIKRAKDKNREPNIIFTNIATSLLSRDWRGMSNWANGVLEIYYEEDNA